jgi:hypothetical protein
MGLCPTRVAIEAEIGPDGQSTLKFKVTSGPPLPLRPFGVRLDVDPIKAFIAMPPSAVDPNLITEAGKAIQAGLAQDPNFATSLGAVKAAVLPSRGIVIHIPNYAPAAHNYPWEILHDGAAFIAPDVAFTRTVEPRAGAQRAKRVLDGNLRLLSIIAAVGVDGKAEWNALSAACAGYAHGLDRLVLVSDPQLKEHIAIEASPQIVEMVPATEPDLVARIEQFAPHICHVFCHGTPLGLQIANYNTEFGARPLTLAAQSLAPCLKSAWLVCLNACSTGAADEAAGTSTVGSELVEAGVPFVPCMRENVPAEAASVFTRDFLVAALSDLSTKSGGQTFDLNFDSAMIRARLGLAQFRNGGGFSASKEWTLPVLCTSGEQDGPVAFSVAKPAVPGGAGDLVATIREITDLQAALATGTFEPQRVAIEARIASLRRQLPPLQ